MRRAIISMIIGSVVMLIGLSQSVSAHSGTVSSDQESITFSQLLKTHSFSEIWHPGWIVITLVLIGAYIWVTGPFRDRFQTATAVPWSKKTLFISGVFVQYLSLGSPLELLSSYLFSAHMFQMALYYLVMPPLLLSGIPAWLIRPLFNIGWLKITISLLTRPWIMLVVFHALFSFYHFPSLYDFFANNVVFDSMAHTLILISAMGMWWNLTCPVPEREPLSDLQKMAYIALSVVLLYPSCILIAFSNSVMFTAYADAPQVFRFLPPLEDQRAGGVLMNITQELVLGILVTPFVYRWIRKDKAKQEKEDERLARMVAERFENREER